MVEIPEGLPTCHLIFDYHSAIWNSCAKCFLDGRHKTQTTVTVKFCSSKTNGLNRRTPKTIGEVLCSKCSKMEHVYNCFAKIILLIRISLRCHRHNLRRAPFISACLQSARFSDALAGIGAQNLQRASKTTVERTVAGHMAGVLPHASRSGVPTDALTKLLMPGNMMREMIN